MTRYLAFFLLTLLFACSSPHPGPDKTLGGAVLGAGWGAGAGAVVGHQVGYGGEGAAVGAGFGALGGGLAGLGYDLEEDAMLDQEEALASIKLQNEATARQLINLQNSLDRTVEKKIGGGVHQVFFDLDTTSLRSGAIANLEILADQIKKHPHVNKIRVVGHSDDSGSPEYNARLAEARARSVSSYLAARGISMDRIEISSHGSERPVAANSTDVGRQLNRRVDIYVE